MATPSSSAALVEGCLTSKATRCINSVFLIPWWNLIFDKAGFQSWYAHGARELVYRFCGSGLGDQKQAGYRQKFNIPVHTPMREEERPLVERDGARRNRRKVLSDFQKLMPGLNVDPIEYTFIGGDILYLCRRRDSTRRFNLWCASLWIAFSSRIRTQRVRNRPPTEGSLRRSVP